MRYRVRYVHKISPSPKDVLEAPIDIPAESLANRKTLGAALRNARVMSGGESLREFRVEHDKVVAFPSKSIWHSIILTPA